MEPHPIRLLADGDLRRSRLTVLFRLLLALPHLFWLSVWQYGVFFAVIGAWFAGLVRGEVPPTLHRFLAGYVRYLTHVSAYLLLAGNPFPPFLGRPGGYAVDAEVDDPRPQPRWSVGFRLVLAIPALLVYGVLSVFWGGVAALAAFLAWFACLATGRMPGGLRDLIAYALRYQAQAVGYVLLVTARYPDADPAEPGAVPQDHPIRLSVEDDLRRSRLTVFFRLLLVLPHAVWLSLWAVAAVPVAVANWLVSLVRGRPAAPLHRFLAAFVRYSTHVSAFLYLVANPFPGFAGTTGSYPVDVEIGAPGVQSRWTTGFRALLAIPALLIVSALSNVLTVVALLGWFHSLVRGRMTPGLRDLGAYVLRYSAQTYGYVLLLAARYPHSGPPA